MGRWWLCWHGHRLIVVATHVAALVLMVPRGTALTIGTTTMLIVVGWATAAVLLLVRVVRSALSHVPLATLMLPVSTLEATLTVGRVSSTTSQPLVHGEILNYSGKLEVKLIAGGDVIPL